jgi:hypothetical protein
MNKTELKQLLKGALSQDASVNFADREEAAVKALCEYYGLDPKADYREIKRNPRYFSVIEEVIDEILPERLTNIMGQFADIKTFGRDEEVIYKVEKIGKKRALMGIVPGARAGRYKAHRLDGYNLSISTSTITAGVFVNLEEILLGKASLADLMNNILDGVEYYVYKEIVKAMRTLKTLAPKANVASAAGVSTAAVDGLVRVISAYGKPTIFCFQSMAAKFNNLTGLNSATPNISVKDIDEIRDRGLVSIYKGTPIVVIPNYLEDEIDNSAWTFSEADAFIVPAAAKPVVVAFQGEGYLKESEHTLGGAEMNYHRMMGTAVIFCNNCAVYSDTEIQNSESGKNLI